MNKDGHWISSEEYAIMELVKIAQQAKKAALALAKEESASSEYKVEKFFNYFDHRDIEEFWVSSSADC